MATTAAPAEESTSSTEAFVETALRNCIRLEDPADRPAQTGANGGSWVVRGCAKVALQRWTWLLQHRPPALVEQQASSDDGTTKSAKL